MPSTPLNLAVLVSGSGTTLQNLLDCIARGELNARIKIVIGSKLGLKGVDRAAVANIPSHVVDRKSLANSSDFSSQVFRLIDDAKVDLVVLAGWLCLLDIPTRYEGRVMNIHPALLPNFGGKGMYGQRVHAAVIEHGCKVSGCTVHFVDGSYDSGPIVAQRTCPVLDNDTPETLAARVFEEEKIAYPEAIKLFHEGRLQVNGRRVAIVENSTR